MENKELIQVLINNEPRYLDADLCQRLRYGFIALHNEDGSIEEGQAIVNQCYPDDTTKLHSGVVFLYTDKEDDRCWAWDYQVYKHTYPISAFFSPTIPVETVSTKREIEVSELQSWITILELVPSFRDRFNPIALIKRIQSHINPQQKEEGV